MMCYKNRFYLDVLHTHRDRRFTFIENLEIEAHLGTADFVRAQLFAR